MVSVVVSLLHSLRFLIRSRAARTRKSSHALRHQLARINELRTHTVNELATVAREEKNLATAECIAN